jgi:hypothetical protein
MENVISQIFVQLVLEMMIYLAVLNALQIVLIVIQTVAHSVWKAHS